MHRIPSVSSYKMLGVYVLSFYGISKVGNWKSDAACTLVINKTAVVVCLCFKCVYVSIFM